MASYQYPKSLCLVFSLELPHHIFFHHRYSHRVKDFWCTITYGPNNESAWTRAWIYSKALSCFWSHSKMATPTVISIWASIVFISVKRFSNPKRHISDTMFCGRECKMRQFAFTLRVCPNITLITVSLNTLIYDMPLNLCRIYLPLLGMHVSQ